MAKLFQRLAALPPIREVDALMQQVDDAGLQDWSREDGCDRLLHPPDSIGHGNQGVRTAPLTAEIETASRRFTTAD
jgi:hypothetical protein